VLTHLRHGRDTSTCQHFDVQPSIIIATMGKATRRSCFTVRSAPTTVARSITMNSAEQRDRSRQNLARRRLALPCVFARCSSKRREGHLKRTAGRRCGPLASLAQRLENRPAVKSDATTVRLHNIGQSNPSGSQHRETANFPLCPQCKITQVANSTLDCYQSPPRQFGILHPWI
jgi:hypothetical protein